MTTRRRFLCVLGAGTIAGVAVHTLASCAPATPLTAATLPQGLTFDPSGAPVIFGKDAGGIYAMTSICTHAGCDMTQQGAVTASEADCYCHGSTFDENGTPTGGPAFSPLVHFKVSIAKDGTLSADTNTVVASSVRVPA